jgi:hypothetical protein
MSRGKRTRLTRTSATTVEGPPGLLMPFIRDTLAQRVEPSRQGTPRGSPIGYPRSKVAAVLFTALTNTPVKETAKLLGVSYGVLRLWRTEAEFKARVEQLRHEFVTHFWTKADEFLEAHSPTLSFGEIDRVVTEGPPVTAWARQNLADAPLYHPQVVGSLLGAIGEVGSPRWSSRVMVLQELAERRGETVLRPEVLEAGWRAAFDGMWEFIEVVARDKRASGEQEGIAALYRKLLRRQMLLLTDQDTRHRGQASRR